MNQASTSNSLPTGFWVAALGAIGMAIAGSLEWISGTVGIPAQSSVSRAIIEDTSAVDPGFVYIGVGIVIVGLIAHVQSKWPGASMAVFCGTAIAAAVVLMYMNALDVFSSTDGFEGSGFSIGTGGIVFGISALAAVAGAASLPASTRDAGGKVQKDVSDVPPGWHPDPKGECELRYWDGSVWTEHVHNYPDERQVERPTEM